MTDPCTIQLFGGLRLRLADRVITRFRTQKTGALLAYLAYHTRQSHSREVLIEIFWPDTEPESGRHNLSHALSSLRSLLEPPGVPAGSVIVADRFSVELNPDAFTTDVAQFEQALRVAAQARNSPEQADLLLQALDRYTGPLLPEHYQDWIIPAQERLALRFRQASLQAVELLERAGDRQRAFEVLQRALALDPQSDAADSPLQRAALRLEGQVSQRPTPERQVSPVLPPAFPVGTVTVLLTDIEGSTALWERTGDAFKDALATHHALLRREFQRNGGQEVKEAGDSFLVVFPSVADALACAIACQRTLARQSWPEATGRLRVRMALHTGDVEWENGEYHGIMLHRAARMLSAAHGGQTLCSEATSSLLVRDLEPEVRLKDLGLWQLRDVKEPERLFQVEYPDLEERTFPPLNASPAHRTHLPLQFTRFFGREAEIAQIVESLSSPDTRLLSLTGPGGTGKTRLSLESVARYAQSFEGAIWFVPLADLSDPHLIPQAIVQAMGQALSGSKEPMEQAVAALSQQPTLLILDNVEQLVDGGAEVVQSLLRQVATLQIVATSRQLLGLPGEVEFPVAPLPTPNGSDTPEHLSLFESVRLFVDRAQIAKPDFRITNANAPALAELCDRLEGIPLAIELAAARALVLTPSQMLSQLSNRFEFLVSRKRGVAERQRTLRAAIDWSYKLLPPDLQRFFAQLCVFRGGWSLEAAESVCEEPLALDMLAQLRECSLITTEESEYGIRFRMLEMLREYATPQLSPEDRDRLETRHAQYIADQMEAAEASIDGPAQRRWLERLNADHDNLRAALDRATAPEERLRIGLRIAGAARRFWEIHGHYREGRAYCAALLDAARTRIGDEALGYVLVTAGTLAWRQSDTPAAEALFDESLSVFQATGDRRGAFLALKGLGNQAINRGDYASARQRHEAALSIAREREDSANVAGSLCNLATTASFAGDLDSAVALYRDAAAVFRQVGNPQGLALVLSNLAGSERARGKPDEARSLDEEALAIYRSVGDRRGVLQALCGLGDVACDQGDLPYAKAKYAEGLRAASELEDPLLRCWMLEGLGRTFAQAGDPDRAARLWGHAAHLRNVLDLPVPRQHDRDVLDRSVTAAREALGDDAFDRAWNAGREMTIEQAVDFALAQAEP